jgi:hypothetical protein
MIIRVETWKYRHTYVTVSNLIDYAHHYLNVDEEEAKESEEETVESKGHFR